MGWKAHLRLLPFAAVLGLLAVLVAMVPASAGKTVKTIGFSSPTYSAVKGEDANATIWLTRSVTTGKLTATVMTANGTATAGYDYTASRAKATFKDGDATASASVPILLNPSAGGPRTVSLTLKVGGWTISPAGATLYIYEDPPPTQPTGVGYHVPTMSEVHITWTAGVIDASADNSYYKVWRTEGASQTSVDLGRVDNPGSGTAELIDYGPFNVGVTNHYDVLAYNGSNAQSSATRVDVPEPGNLVGNGDFEYGDLSAWTPSTATGQMVAVQSLHTHSGAYAAQIYTAAKVGSSSITQWVYVPTGTSASLTYYLNASLGSGDSVLVEVWATGYYLAYRTLTASTNGWEQGDAVDLSAYQGWQVRVTFTVTGTSTNNGGSDVFIDDVIAPFGLTA